MDTQAQPDPWQGLDLGPGGGVPVAIGGEVSAPAVLGAYRRGIFCQPRTEPGEIAANRRLYEPDVAAGYIAVLPGEDDPYATLWWSPATRFVLPADQLHIGRTLRRTLARNGWTTTVDWDVRRVIGACRTGREPCWLTDGLVSALGVLSDHGWIRSVEVWDGDDLIGGLFGCAFEHVFVMDSAFRTRSDAAKVAIVDLARRASHCGIALLDAQVRSEYTDRFGAVSMTRAEYVRQLGEGRANRRLPTARRPVAELAD